VRLKHYSNLSAVERTGMLTIRDYFAILQVSVQDFNSNNQWVTLDDHGNVIPIPIENPMGMGNDDTIGNGNGKEWESP